MGRRSRIESDRTAKHVRRGEGRSLWVFGEMVTFYALGEDTGGAFTLFEEIVAPQTGSLPHLHHEEDQGIYVMEGEHEFVCEGRAFAARAGSFVYIPRGVVHSFENVGEMPGRLLIFSTPAGGTESFFFEVGEPATEGSSPPANSLGPRSMEDVARLREIARKHGSDIDTLALLQQLSATTPPQQAAKSERTAKGGGEDE